ncbi:uncharacterized protein LOC112501003 [Cynara cardunculus var. scolymus]|uniref:Uncharacterized protein n=1 Tax=Cynara cardunculus var. scolymus TaxID=59895 RepID=A0A103Y4A1_CYNCS|nr:uncharacterized protein LOC112501003 [Cynara cardunculus var. scolymus]KVI02254.1 hypothetical protein Ccrd_019476 [Cynara cardunculus var. scolymus]
MESKTNRKMALSAIDGGGKIIENEVDVVKNTDSMDHWDFLEEIEAPMWADLRLCDLINDEIDDPWFDISHQFHQCSSSQLLSRVFHSGKAGGSNSISVQEPSSPKLPSSVSKSRGKSYKTKEWGQRRCMATSNKQHPVKALISKSSRSIESSNTEKPVSRTGKVKENEGLKACSSCESGLTDTSRPKFVKSSSCSLARQEQEQENSSQSTVTFDRSERQENKGLEVSFQTSSQTSGLLSSLRISLRRSCATRPAARVVANGGRQSEGCKSSSNKSSVGSPLDQGSVSKKITIGDAQNKLITRNRINVARVSQPPRNKSKAPNATKAPASNVRNLSNRQGNKTLASKVTTKGKVQQHTSVGKVLMPHKVNEQRQMVDKEAGKVGVGRRTTFLTGIKETASATMATSQKTKSSDKAAQSMGHVQRASKQSLTQKNGGIKLIGLKETTNNRSKDKDTANPARKVYFR